MYKHKVQYYETDKMGITHHSNYIRWMEESRVDYLNSIGYGYERLEKEGVISPVVAIDCKYKKTTTFPDVITIEVKVKEYNGVKLLIEYSMKNESGEDVFEAVSTHTFLDINGGILRMRNAFPEFHQLLLDQIEK